MNRMMAQNMTCGHDTSAESHASVEVRDGLLACRVAPGIVAATWPCQRTAWRNYAPSWGRAERE